MQETFAYSDIILHNYILKEIEEEWEVQSTVETFPLFFIRPGSTRGQKGALGTQLKLVPPQF